MFAEERDWTAARGGAPAEAGRIDAATATIAATDFCECIRAVCTPRPLGDDCKYSNARTRGRAQTRRWDRVSVRGQMGSQVGEHR